MHSKNPEHEVLGVFTTLSELKGNLVPGDDLLSHGEAPHYHRR